MLTLKAVLHLHILCAMCFLVPAVVHSVDVFGREAFEYFVYDRGSRASAGGIFRFIEPPQDSKWVHRSPESSNLHTPAWNSKNFNLFSEMFVFIACHHLS